MELNYLAFFIISFIPLLVGYLWYRPSSGIASFFKQPATAFRFTIKNTIVLFLFSVAIVYAYMNLVIHQLGFYELFFTDIMLGNEESKEIVTSFLNQYGDKHRHFGHGVLHGVINAVLIAAPILGALTFLENKGIKYFAQHFLYWLVVSIIIGGCISAFV